MRSASLLLLVVLISGCSTYEERLRSVRQSYASGQYQVADEQLQKLAKDDGDNRHLYELERGVVQLALGDPKQSEALLNSGVDGLESHFEQSVGAYFGAVLSDDRSLDYGGEDYEHILARAVLALASLGGDKRDALAYANAIINKQLEIMESWEEGQDDGNNPKKAYKLVAFGAYLRAILAENDPLKIDEARREFQRVKDLEPGYRDADANLERVTSGHHSQKGYGVVHVLAMVGRGPFKVEVDERASADAIAIAQIIWNQTRGNLTIPHLASVKIPDLAFHTENPTDVVVEVDGQNLGTTAVVTDVNQTAKQQFDTMKNWIVARAILRRVFKTVVVEAAKEAVTSKKEERRSDRDPLDPEQRRRARRENQTNAGAQILISAIGFLWTAVERADTRCWGLLPASFQAHRIELPVGEYEISLRAAYHGNPTGAPQTVQVRVRDGYDTYVVGLVPTLDGGPPPLSSDSVTEPLEPVTP